MKKLIVGNWKSNKSSTEITTWIAQFSEKIQEKSDADFSNISVAIAPPFTGLVALEQSLVKNNNTVVEIAIQDISMYPAGKYTGAISTHILLGFPVKYAIVGHSERRRYFHETSADVALKVEQAVAAGITPIVCVDTPYIDEQASAIENNLLSKCIVAYEPLDAIGSGHAASVAVVTKAIEKIHSVFGDVPVLYGGSVTDMDVNEYLLVADGVLVGGASLDADSFARLIMNTL